MPASCHLIARNRLSRIPRELRLAHEYCFFLHDECARLLVEYEAAGAHNLEIKFRDAAEAEAFYRLAEESTIAALRQTGHLAEARRVILNHITMAMTSDSLHHIYEALRCLEKRKSVVALNLLRKPFTDSLMYLSWILGDEDAFYRAFETGQPEALTLKRLGNHRLKIIADALAQTGVAEIIDPETVKKAIFDRSWESGLQGYFQHAVHLVTVDYPELKTAPENFNFIFSSPFDDDLYVAVYDVLPVIMFYLSNIMLELFDRITPMDPPAKQAFSVRAVGGLNLIGAPAVANEMVETVFSPFEGRLQCPSCKAPMTLSLHNAARMVLTDSLRCGSCRRVGPFPFSYLFDIDLLKSVGERLRQSS